MLEKGAYVVAGDINPVPIEHDRLAFVSTNVIVWKDLSNIFKTTISQHGKIDHVFANAGISGRTNYLEEKLDENGDLLEPTHVVFDINLRGVVNTTALAIHYMRKQPTGGSIVLTASASSFQQFRTVDYTTAKHGVLGLMRGLVPLLQPEIPIRINSIGPSFTRTGLLPDGLVERFGGIPSQGAEVPARSVAVLMADPKRNCQLIYSFDGNQFEAEGILANAAREVVGDMNEDIVMAKILKGIGELSPAERSQYGLSDPGWNH